MNVAIFMQKFLCFFWILVVTLFSSLFSQKLQAHNISTTSGIFTQPKIYHNSIGYLGIPFAQPPIKGKRWKKPLALNTPSQIRISNSFANACYQDSYNIDWYKGIAVEFKHSLDMTMPPVSEDCLYLNIWLPKIKKNINHNIKLPVMVWIHGGSNKSGWSFEPNYIGNNLADHGSVIVISIAYRLGVFGFFSHSELSKQQDKANFALLDQIQALQWIQDNISAFGGDKNNITIMGESAGAANVSYLMATKKAQGLFHKAISQSGGFQWLSHSSIEQAKLLGDKISTSLNADIKQLRLKPSDEIWQTIKDIAPENEYNAVIDNNLFYSSPNLSFKENTQVSLLIGTNQHEFYMYQKEEFSEATIPIALKNQQSKSKLTAIFNRYKNKKAGQDWLDTFLYMSCPSLLMAEIVSQKPQNNAYVYRFDKIRVGGEKLKAYHGAEIPYMFNQHDSWLPTDDKDKTLTNYMLKSWTNFAKYGDPNKGSYPLHPSWPRYNVNHNKIMTLNNKNNIMPAEEVALCQSIWPDYYLQ